MTESSSVAIGGSSPVKVRFSLTNSTRTPLQVSIRTMRRSGGYVNLSWPRGDGLIWPRWD